MSAKKKSKIFIVDDHPVLTEGLEKLINHEEDMCCVGDATNATLALESIEKVKPDLVLMDISLEGTSGIELTKTLLLKHPKLLILVLSMYDESIYVDRVLQAGARGYLMKREATEHIMVAIRRVLAGDIYVSDKWKDKLVAKFASGKSGKSNGDNFISPQLSDRQLEVLQFVGQGYSTKKIASELYVSVKTIESHYDAIKIKLDLKNFHELIQYAVKMRLSEN